MSTATRPPEPPPAAAKARASESLADSVLILLSFAVVQRVVGFVRGMLFCRWLDPGQLGQWDLAFSFLMLAAPVAVLGLPGSFGRYVEHYRQQGQLRAFLRRTLVTVAVLAMTGALIVAWWRESFGVLLFGGVGGPTAVLAPALLAVIVHHALIEVFGGLRNFRAVSVLQFVHSLLFATFGTTLILFVAPTAGSIVAAYGGACLLCIVGSLRWARGRTFSSDSAPLAHRALWSKLVPFALWVWVTNWLTNLFGIVDRYMIVHVSGLSSAEALVQVGNYHSSRILPLLLFSVAGMISTATLPHLSHDWEAGRRGAVGARLRLLLKLMALVLSATGVVVILAAPLVFDVAFQGKFALATTILPWTLTYFTWSGLSLMAANYLWCSEKARLNTFAMFVGLVVNVALNAVLLPRYQLQGAVIATSAAHLVLLTLVLLLNRRVGMGIDHGTWILALLPGLLWTGPAICSVLLIAAVLEAFTRDWLFDSDEKQRMTNAWNRAVTRGRSAWQQFRAAPA